MPEGEDRNLALSPRASWHRRRDALLGALTDARAKRVVLVDIDAAWTAAPSGGAIFEDASNTSERASFFGDLLRYGVSVGWTFVRTAPMASVTEALADVGLTTRTKGGAAGEQIAGLAPTLQPLARWLTRSGGVSRADLERLLDEAEDAADREDALLSLFEDILEPDARDALRRIALLREEHTINGAAGPFGPDASEPLRVSAECLDALKGTGALSLRGVAGAHAHRFSVPSIVRDQLAQRISIVDAALTRATRHAIARHLPLDSAERTLEAHRQAVLSDDLEQAKRTARYYATDLREIAHRLSRRAKEEQNLQLYREAAKVYETIVADFDGKDAYAWQYLAFNLEHCRAWRDEPAEAEKIRSAYQRSCAFAQEAGRYNPLYHGRRLAFNLVSGLPRTQVRRELTVHIQDTRTQYGDEHVRWLVLPVKAAADRDFWHELTRAHPWISRLRRPDRERPLVSEV